MSSYGRAGIRKDSWTHRQDVLLAETILTNQAAGLGITEAAAVAAPLVGRSAKSCYDRWNTELKHKHWGDLGKPKPNERRIQIVPDGAERAAGPANDGIEPIECLDAIEAATANLTGSEAYSTGQIIRILWSWKRVGGAAEKAAAALKEARWYLDRLIAKVEGAKE